MTLAIGLAGTPGLSTVNGLVIERPGAKPVLLTQGLTNAADLTVEAATKPLLIPDMYFLTTTVNGQGIYWFSN